MATACLPDPSAQLAQMAVDYIHQDYEHAPGKPPKPRHVSQVFGAKLHERFTGREAEVLGHAHYRLHVFTSRGRHVLQRQGRLRMPLGYMGAFLTNTVSRKAMGNWLERVVFSDAREPLPLTLHDYRTHAGATGRDEPAAQHPGQLFDPLLAGGRAGHPRRAARRLLGRRHHRLPPAPGLRVTLPDGLVLYPHFQKTVIPGWLDKALKHRHRATAHLDRVVLLSPRPEWIATLPNAKLPDRNDFKAYGDDLAGRVAAWSRALC